MPLLLSLSGLRLAKNSARPTWTFRLHLATTGASAALIAASNFLPFTYRTYVLVKIVALYAALVVEVGSEVAAACHDEQIALPPHLISERFGTLTLIVMGEGEQCLPITRSRLC